MAEVSTHDAWITEQINGSIPEGERWTPREAAEKLVARLEESEPARFDEWMRDNALRTLHQAFNARLRSDRARRFSRMKARRFGEAAEAYAAGDNQALDPYLIQYVIDEDAGLRLNLGDMTGNDCFRAAEPFRRRVAENSRQAAFLEKLGREAGRRKIKNVYSREQLASVFATLGLAVAS
jgi:hypothetical protein